MSTEASENDTLRRLKLSKRRNTDNKTLLTSGTWVGDGINKDRATTANHDI